MPLNPKQQRFVAEYLKDLNASQACIRAGYSKKNPNVDGPRLLANTGIATAVAAAQAQLAAKHEVTLDRLIGGYARIAFNDPRTFFDTAGEMKPLHTLDATAAQTLTFEAERHRDADTGEMVTTTKIKPWDKIRSLDALGKHLGMFKDKLEVTGTQDELYKELLMWAKRLNADRAKGRHGHTP